MAKKTITALTKAELERGGEKLTAVQRCFREWVLQRLGDIRYMGLNADCTHFELLQEADPKWGGVQLMVRYRAVNPFAVGPKFIRLEAPMEV